MAPQKLKPNDARATHNTVTVRGKTYHYLFATPLAGRPAAGTILLTHGFPDLAFGWRNQIPFLAEELGLQVIVPDMLGYGQTDAPEAVEPYGYKSVCADLVAIVDHVGIAGSASGEGDKTGRFFVGGHDWGGAVAWRMALWHADRLRGVFSVCTPYFAPSNKPFVELVDMVKVLPNFAYQLQFASDNLWRSVQGPARLRQFLNVMYGGKAAAAGDASPYLFSTTQGVAVDRLDEVGPAPLLSAEEMDYYVAEYSRSGLHGPTNWYRSRRVNWEDEKALFSGNAEELDKITVPSLMVAATSDAALPSTLSEQMGRYFENLTRTQIPGGHWALVQSAEAVNADIKEFLTPLLGGQAAQKASL